MTLDAAEFIRRFVLHVLPSGFHRIRHYGLFAGTVRARNTSSASDNGSPRLRLRPLRRAVTSRTLTPKDLRLGRRCPCCGGRMIIVETFDGARPARSRPIADPDQDRHPHDNRDASRLAVPPSPSPPLARRSRNPMSSATSADFLSSRCATPAARITSPPKKARRVRFPDDNTGCPPPPPPHQP